MLKNPSKAVEDFIEKVVAPARVTWRADAEARRARAELDRQDTELARRQLRESGIDAERLDKLAAERSKERRKLVEQARRRAVDASAAVADRLAGRMPIIPPIDPIDTVIDQVTFIRSYAGQGIIVDSNVGPSDNWARYQLNSSVDSEDLPGRLSFFTLWQNRRSTPTVIMARPNLVINAHLSCAAEWNGTGSWAGTISGAGATVRVRTTIWSMDSKVSSIVHDQIVGQASAKGGFFGDDSSTSIEFNELLPASGVAILPQAYSLIEVELLTEWQTIGGSVVLDAEEGSHRVSMPQLILTEMQTPEPPPISVTAGVDYATSPATVTLLFSGATGTLVDIFQDGVRLGDTENDGSWSRQLPPGTYSFRVCERLSSVCSMEVSVTVAQ